jgi:iron complex outermembrane recepter protein
VEIANEIVRSGAKATKRRVSVPLRAAGCAIALGVSLAASGWAQTAGPGDLTLVSLEELMDIQVTSVSKKEQSLLRTGAAVFVITR